jgi:hypothetical protein
MNNYDWQINFQDTNKMKESLAQEVAVILPLKSISDQIYEYLKARILYGDIVPGERLVQEKVAEQLEISRIPVRKAFRPNRYTGAREPWGDRYGGEALDLSGGIGITPYPY